MSNILANIKMLIVDDDEELRSTLVENFKMFGAIVSSAKSGNEAIKILETESFQIVFSDMRMPNGDGLSLLTYINKHLTNPPLFYLYSGFNDVNIDEKSYPGLTYLFQKPTRLTLMVDVIANHLKARSAAKK